jgi:hypothetical protein
MHRSEAHCSSKGQFFTVTRKTIPTRARATEQRTPVRATTISKLELVREGVRRFILMDASIGDFHKAARTAAKLGELSPNPLTGAKFRGIVKEAIKDRKRENLRRTALRLKQRKDAAL